MQQDRRLARMAQAMGLEGPEAVTPAVRQMNRRLGLPSGLKALGVTESMFPGIIAGALKDHCHKTNPREASAEDYVSLLAASM